MEAAFISLSLVAGSLLAVQAGANTQLSKATGSPFTATTVQVVIAAALLLLIAAATGTVGAFRDLPSVPWWHVVGGIATAIYVASTILLFPRLGAVVTVGLFIAGQMAASLGLDAFGVLGVHREPLGPMTIIGTTTVFSGAAGIVFGQKGAMNEISSSKLGWMLLALFAGAVLPVQGAINGLLRTDLGAPFAVGTISFLVATLAMLAVLLITRVLTDTPKSQFTALANILWRSSARISRGLKRPQNVARAASIWRDPNRQWGTGAGEARSARRPLTARTFERKTDEIHMPWILRRAEVGGHAQGRARRLH
jgi:bacterial/archaeal transporter family-2 protein